jgi:hypothetical protein
MLAYGTAADSFDQYFRIAESTMLVSIERFTKSVIDVLKEEYLRIPTASEPRKVLAQSRDCFQEKLVQLIAQSGSGRTVPRPGLDSLLERKVSLP